MPGIYPYPFAFFSEERPPILNLVQESGTALDALAVSKASRTVEKYLTSTASGSEAPSLLRSLLVAAVQEAGSGMDALTVAKTSRLVEKYLADVASGSESITASRTAVQLALQEAGSTIDVLAVEKASRLAEKYLADVAVGAESIDVIVSALTLAVQEAGSAIDDLTVEKASRIVQKYLADTAVGTETIDLIRSAVSFTTLEAGSAIDALTVTKESNVTGPQIVSCTAVQVVNSIRADFDTGQDCESVMIELIYNLSVVNTEYVETTPNTTGYQTLMGSTQGSGLHTIRVTPYDGNLSGGVPTGTAGDPCSDSVNVP